MIVASDDPNLKNLSGSRNQCCGQGAERQSDGEEDPSVRMFYIPGSPSQTVVYSIHNIRHIDDRYSSRCIYS